MLAATLTVLSLAISSAEVEAAPSPLMAIQDVGGVLTANFDSTAFDTIQVAYEEERGVELTDFRLPGETSVTLALYPIRAMVEGGAAIAMTEEGERRIDPKITLFSGFARGHESDVFLGISRDMVHGYIHLDGELFVISSGPQNRGGPVIIAHSRVAFGSIGRSMAFCQMLQNPLADGALQRGGARDLNGGSASSQGGSPVVRLADTFIEGSPEFVDLFAGAPDPAQAAVDYATLLFAASSQIFRRDVGAVFIIPDGWLRVWTITPPWGNTDLFAVRDWWDSNQNPDRNLPRVSVHILDSPVSGGVAWLSALCSQSIGYAYSSVFGFFPYPIEHTSDDNWDLLVVSHEAGHNWGSLHTFDYTPEIDCEDGSGPDRGTLMGYCHLNPGGISNVGMRLHPRVQDVIRSYAGSVPCLDVIPIQLGDYDYDGVLEQTDLMALDKCLTQGFYSEGCVETFDMNQDGQLDDCDREILEATVDGGVAASWSNYGTGWPGTNGIPAIGLDSVPDIGEALELSIENSSGVTTFGVLFVGVSAASDPTGLGGTLLVSISQTLPITIPANGFEVSTELPCDADLVGVTLFAQALQSDPGASLGVSFSPGLELVIGL